MATHEYVLSLGSVDDLDTLAELIADARLVPIPAPRTASNRAIVIDLTLPTPARVLRIPEATASLVDGLDPYGN